MKDQLIFDITEIADSDSVGAYLRSSDGTLITHTTDGAREAIDVFTELGRDESSTHTSGDVGVGAWGVRNDAGTALAADGEYIPLSMDASGALRVNAVVNVDADSDYAEDSAHSSGDIGGFVLGIRMDDVDGTNTALLAGTEGDYQGFFTNDKGEMHVRDNDSVDLLTSIDGTLTALSKAEDSVHASGDQGIMGLAVRNDTLASLVSADGDYAPLQVDADGALYTYITGSDLLTVNDAALANTAIANAANPLTAANTAEDVVISPLASRKYLWIYNNGNKKVFVGASGVSATTGFPISPGSYMEMRAGASVDIEWVSANTGQEIRTMEMS